jgi:hypothetical protein
MRDVIKINKPNAAKAAHVLTTGIALVSAAVAISLPIIIRRLPHSRKIRQLLDGHRILLIIIQVSEMSKQHLKLLIFSRK